MTKVAALYVETNGCYYGLDDVDPWDQARDARRYPGPDPVIAHPPCERWGRYWGGGPMLAGTDKQKKLGDDNDCFDWALYNVRKYGGVLEHPEASHAWKTFGLNKPPFKGGWIPAGDEIGWTCCVAQGHYGHRAQKMTWLYVVNTVLPELHWGRAVGLAKLDDGFHSAEERRRAIRTGVCQRLSSKQRRATPVPFRNLLLNIAKSVYDQPQRS